MNRHQSRSLWMLAILTVIVGCIPSLNPVYTDETLTFEPALLGVWRQPDANALWDFKKFDDKSYRLSYTDDNGQIGHFVGRLARLEGELFLDLYPEEVKSEGNGFYKFHVVPIHSIYRVKQADGQLKLAAIDFQWLDSYLTQHPDEIDTATFGGRKMITGPTPDVQKFVLAHKEMFTSDFDLRKIENAN
jgi:hypothetical protein